MQLVCADNGVLQMEKVTKTNCSMCINESQQQQQQQLQQQQRQSTVISPVPADHLASLPVNSSKSITTTGQPFYVCTVTCCDSVNCTKPSTTSLISKAIVSKADTSCHTFSAPFPAPSTAAVAHRVNGILSPALELQQTAPNCPACVKTRQNRPRLVLITNPSTEYINGDCGTATVSLPRVKDTREGSVSPKLSSVSVLKGSSEQQCNPLIAATPPLLGTIKSPQQPAKQPSIRRSPKLQLMGTEKINSKALLHSPELSSSPPVLGNSSFTDYTEPYTPVCTSVNSNAADSHFKFGISRKPSPLNSEYSFYFANVENHGFFRKAVPALPISMAVLLCLCNLLLPGSGTLIASFSIIFGSQTEYGPGYGCRSFSICFLSALLQFSTAIFVFGWVWSIMWGIVFIKNSLRYGEKRDIHTISLC